jgi:hypothetical protein
LLLDKRKTKKQKSPPYLPSTFSSPITRVNVREGSHGRYTIPMFSRLLPR